MNDVSRMEAGRELDALVAERVFGWTSRVWSIHPNTRPLDEIRAAFERGEVMPTVSVAACRSGRDVPLEVLLPDGEGDMPVARWTDASGFEKQVRAYSTSIAHAWLVVEKMREGHDFKMLDLHISGGVLDVWRVLFRSHAPESAWVEADADTAPEAICRAALLAVSPPAAPPTERTTHE